MKAVQRWFLSDGHSCDDWKRIIAEREIDRVILRDYNTTDRAALAQAMRDFSRHHHVDFAVAGDTRLAARLNCAFHCPSYQLSRLTSQPALRRGRASNDDSVAVHNETELRLAHKNGFQTVLLSPVYATNSHPNARPLGVLRARNLARLADTLGLRALALGGMNEAAFHRLDPDAQLFNGYAAISAFAGTDKL